jgi:hypothetical protein
MTASKVRIARKGIESSERLGRYCWVVERTISWLYRNRRLSVRHERRDDTHQAFLDLAARSYAGTRFSGYVRRTKELLALAALVDVGGRPGQQARRDVPGKIVGSVDQDLRRHRQILQVPAAVYAVGLTDQVQSSGDEIRS